MMMSNSMRIIVTAMPYVVTIFLLLGYISPSFESASRTHAELKTQTEEFDRLAQKIKEKEVLLEQKRLLDKDIQRMRASVPPSPEMDILLIDIEKLSEEAGTDLISIEPSADAKKEKGDNLMDSIIAEVGGRMTPTGKPPAVPPPKTPAPPPSAVKPAVIPEANPLGIQHLERRVFVSGSYSQLVDFLKRLEAYQRIVGIRNLIIAMPENSDHETVKTLASEKGRNLDLTQPVMTFLMSVYYLP
ncbi:MAG: hypothetical protein SGJ27_02445 [Candidatus Melainabacteria bacterium]|nr:hypothetical protein [Candidatus Melainabacteria bacterium]